MYVCMYVCVYVYTCMLAPTVCIGVYKCMNINVHTV